MGEVVWLLYAYIDLLTTKGGVAEWIYDELRSVCEMRFNFQDKAAPADTASALASKMLVGLGFCAWVLGSGFWVPGLWVLGLRFLVLCTKGYGVRTNDDECINVFQCLYKHMLIDV